MIDDLQIRPKLSDILDVANLRRQIENGNISEKQHPEYGLKIYNYTPQANFSDNAWDHEVMTCRGLIVNMCTQEVLARPFKKFFNINTSYLPETFVDVLPKSNPQVLNKLDGSLGILYDVVGDVQIATRGSFSSDQAKWATAWYRNHVKELRAKGNKPVWPEGWTPLFEIIYPENRIVVNYDYEGLVLIGMVNNATGEELEADLLEMWAMMNRLRCTESYKGKTLLEVIQEPVDTHNREGFVLTWFNPYIKVKVKFEEYCRLHKVITGLNPKTVWEMLQTDEGEEEIRTLCHDETLPKSFRDWLNTAASKIARDVYLLDAQANELLDRSYEEIDDKFDDIKLRRKVFAAKFVELTNVSTEFKRLLPILFRKFDREDDSDIIWKLVKPQATQPFREDGEA